MTCTVCLNVVRHPVLPVPRGEETWEQFTDTAWRARNDDINPVRAGPQVAAAVRELLLAPDRPLLIRHSPTVRARKGAELFRDALDGRLPLTLSVEPALREPDFAMARVLTRAEFEAPDRSPLAVILRLFHAIVEDDPRIVPGGRAAVADAVATLRRIVETDGPVNHLWVTHAPVMPFIYMGVVEGLAPEQWTVARAAAHGRYDYARGFAVRLPWRSPGRGRGRRAADSCP